MKSANTNSKQKLEHAKAKRGLHPGCAEWIESSDNPKDALNRICAYSIVDACAIIDSMSPLGATFMIHLLRDTVRNNPEDNKVYNPALLARCEELRTRGTDTGFVEAWLRTARAIYSSVPHQHKPTGS